MLCRGEVRDSVQTSMELPCSPISPAEQAKIRQQLDRMLGTTHFKQSRRYPALLRYIVEETLRGHGNLLKERVLGVEVFARDPSYDTAADPIVRVTIAEIRKRIAQYYHDEAHDAEIRIELPAGHYVAEFRAGKPASPALVTEDPVASLAVAPPPDPPREHLALDLAEAPPVTPAAVPSPALQSRVVAWRKAAFGLALVLIAGLVGGFVYQRKHPPALEELWAPLISPGKQILFCLPTDVGRHRGALTSPGDLFVSNPEKSGRPAGRPEVVTFLDHETRGENVVFSDAVATVKIANLLAMHFSEYRIKLNVDTTLDDLRQGPSILIGGLDNQWTMQAISSLRFRFAGSDDEGYWISDTRHPGDRKWSLNLRQEYAKVTRDYALIARVHNGQAGQPEMVVAGIGMSGTMAAGEFLVDPQQVKRLKQWVGPGFADRDFEAVLSTDVANGVAGAPHIVDIWVR